MRTWKYGISFAEKSPMTAPLPLAGDLYENMQKAVDYGYDAIEFHTRETYPFDFDRLREMRETGRGDICAIVTGRLYTEGHHGLLDEDPASVDTAMSAMKLYIDAAQKLGTDIVLGWAKGNVPPGGDRGEYLRRLAERLKILDAYAGERGVRILVEVINHYETNIFNTARETLAFFQTYHLDHCYVHLDTFHMGIEECDPYAAIRLCGERLGYFHVADNTRRYPGSGQFDFPRILKTLAEIRYSGYVTVECIPEPDRDTAAQNAIAHLKACEPQA